MPPKKSAAKKKKAASNARGFATTSVPRRKDPEEEAREAAAKAEAAAAAAAKGAAEEGAGGAANGAGEGEREGQAEQEGAGANGAAAAAQEEWDPEASEKQALQALAEKVRPACDKEINRVVKVIEYERRLSKTMSGYAWTEQDLQRRIIELALADLKDDVPQPVNEPEDKVVAKVAILFGILEQLGFTPKRIEECLRAVRVMEIDDCLDWLFLHCDAEELACEGPIAPPAPIADSILLTPRIQSTPPSPTSNLKTAKNPSVQAPMSPPPARSRTTTTSSLSPLLDEASTEEALRARILAYDEELEQSLSGATDCPEDERDANQKYAALKLQLSEIQRAQGASKRASKGKGDRKGANPLSEEQEEWMEMQAEVLRKKIKAIEADYTFRKVDAEKLYREERTKLDAAQLAARLNGTTLESSIPEFDPSTTTATRAMERSLDPSLDISIPASTVPNGISSLPPSPGQPPEPEPNGIKSPAATAEADGDADGFFGNLLDEMPAEETNDFGTMIPVRNMALPKHFSGKTPKVNLEETVRKLDKYATVVFGVLSRSRAVRASVTVRWGDSGKSTQTFEMQDVACWDQPQAYNYIATVALFAVASSKEGNGMAVNKQLPTIFRDLWDELVAKKKEEDDEEYRNKLKLYKAIAEPRLQELSSRDPRGVKAEKTVDERHEIAGPNEVSPEISQRIQQEMLARQSWPSYQEMLRQRANLPIAAYRTEIMKTIEESQCIVLCGETGCGKSTQVPSFILEHGMRLGRPVKVFCTEPRRISAISLAQRVSAELGEPPNACGTRNSLVGYSIRLDSAVSASTRVVYATTGIVLRMLEGRESLADVTHIIIDEVHERSIDSDFLLIVLREILEVRKDLKVILMSATVDAEKIAAYMGGCPVVRVPGRTFPVTAYFLEDVVELTRYRLDPHSDSPYVARNKRGYGARPRRAIDDAPLDDDDELDAADGADVTQAPLSKQSRITLDCIDQHAINYDLIVSLLENLCFYKPDLVPFSSAILVFLPSLESIRRLSDILEAHQAFGSSQFIVLPLHSTISNESQGLVFNVPRPGVRKIVISTNIAETGVTIPDITAVIDTGKHREMRFDEKRQISRLVETFVAQSNAAQRRGRAGRVREGVAFHLFTKHRHDTIMAEHPQPEMTRLSLQDLALRIKIMKIGSTSIEDTLLKALDPPLTVNIQRAVSSLIEVKALTTTEEITPLGRHLAKLPMDVHLGLFLIMSCIFGCLDAALTITAALNSKSPWLTPFGREAEADAVKRGFKVENSDFLTTYNAYCSWREASGNGYEREFTRKSFLSQQNLQQIEELRQQFFSFLVDAGFISITDAERRQLISTKLGKSRTRFVRVPAELDVNSKDPKAVMACLAASMYPKLLVVDPQNGSLRTLANSAPAAIHPSSVNFAPGRRVDFGPNTRFVAFFTAMHTKKLYVWESGSVDERAVYLLCGNADFQLPAHSLSIDRKIKTRLEPKTAIAMKVLRQQWHGFFKKKMIDPSAPLPEGQQQWLALFMEALVTPTLADDDDKKKKKRDAVKVQLSLTRNG
ncbi:hypothetical protein JCM1841_003894 [Sporobolomyces salmonicolor]